MYVSFYLSIRFNPPREKNAWKTNTYLHKYVQTLEETYVRASTPTHILAQGDKKSCSELFDCLTRSSYERFLSKSEPRNLIALLVVPSI